MPSKAMERGDFICPYANWLPGQFEVKPMHAMQNLPVDLHLHSNYSDGLLSPARLCDEADALGMTCIALCDHDSTDGFEELAAAERDIRARRQARGDARPFIALPCVELSSGRGGRTHLLGYGADAENPALRQCLQEAVLDRRERAEKIISLLARQGVEIPDGLHTALLSPQVGRAHIARALVQVGAVGSMREAFDRFLGEGRSAYIPRKPLNTLTALEILRDAGAVTVLAHPIRLGLDSSALHALADELVAFGLAGLEVYHPSANRANVRALALYAHRKGLIPTGGSDFHGDRNVRARIGRLPSGWSLMGQDVAALVHAMGLALS